jgi:hypothetical protein
MPLRRSTAMPHIPRKKSKTPTPKAPRVAVFKPNQPESLRGFTVEDEIIAGNEKRHAREKR